LPKTGIENTEVRRKTESSKLKAEGSKGTALRHFDPRTQGPKDATTNRIQETGITSKE
jgi:hypothetical protein